MNNVKLGVALVDDHVLLRNGLAGLISSFGEYVVLYEACNGGDFLRQLHPRCLPDLVLLDINMPDMNGYETALWLRSHYPEISILALSMYDCDNSIIRMLKYGVKGYVLKDIEPSELKFALDSVVQRGFYYSELVTGKLIHTLNTQDDHQENMHHFLALNDRELEFLKWACSEYTYKEIAEKMFLSPRTIDGYRDTLFEKLNVKTRVGLVMYAIRNGIVTV